MEENLAYLQKLGLNVYQSRVMAVLLSRREATAKEIYDSVDVPPTKIYQVLSTLEDKELVHFIHGKPRKYTTKGVNTIINKLISKQEKILKALKKEKEAQVEMIKNMEFEVYGRQPMSVHPVLSTERYPAVRPPLTSSLQRA